MYGFFKPYLLYNTVYIVKDISKDLWSSMAKLLAVHRHKHLPQFSQ